MLLLFLGCPASAQQQYNDENDFRTVRLSGNGVAITGYLGTRQAVRIPPKIQVLDVTRIGEGHLLSIN